LCSHRQSSRKFDKKSQIGALDVLDIARNQKVNEYVDKVNLRLSEARGREAGRKRVHSNEALEALEPRKKKVSSRQRVGI